MYEIKASEREVKGETFETFIREVTNANILEVEAGTTGYCGGDTGHGGRTYIRIKDLGSTDITVHELKDKFNNVDGVEIELGGDTELETMIESLEFILKALKDGIEDKERMDSYRNF